MNKTIVILTILSWAFTSSAQQLPFKFDAKAIITLSDADMVSSAYINGKLETEGV